LATKSLKFSLAPFADEQASGFVYMEKKDFGPKTRQLLGIADGVLMAHAFKLIVTTK